MEHNDMKPICEFVRRHLILGLVIVATTVHAEETTVATVGLLDGSVVTVKGAPIPSAESGHGGRWSGASRRKRSPAALRYS